VLIIIFHPYFSFICTNIKKKYVTRLSRLVEAKKNAEERGQPKSPPFAEIAEQVRARF